MANDRIEIGREEPGLEAGRRVRMPPRAEPPFKVFVNGVPQKEGDDYRVRGREVEFARPLVKEGKVSGVRWLAMLLGLFGTYRKNETVDIEYRQDGGTHLAHDLEVLPD
jgi:hypothetical protein